ncbi:MAG TPA: peptidoglycan DD-metalloendopeptidase family protein [Steroidobacteraceae bacterium]|nr:peptidoglycan DD-metalloendopeptidase family protein [Steroidobacteraceae bacterium]
MLGACADTAGDGPENYVVRPEDTLYSIAWRHNLDFRDLARWNNIGGDYRIAVGQVLVLGPMPGAEPAPGTAPVARAATPAPSVSSASAGSRAPDVPQVSKPQPLPQPESRSAARGTSSPLGTPIAPEPKAAHAPNSRAERWVWPTDRTGAPRPVPGGGILLPGRLGQDVRAASAGRVVYTGSGLRGYGNLIIIKHADSLLSAYAHNREMLVHDGQDVAAGQVIAHMGEGAHNAAILYFELRQNGRPIDPLPFLPR